MITTLADLGKGESGVVVCLRLSPERARTLTRLGLCPGAELSCLRRLPLGDPTVYRWRGTEIALRRRDASCVEVISKKQ